MNYVVEKFDVLLLMISVEKKNKGKYVISIQIKVFLFNIVLLNVKWNPTKIFWSRKNLIKVMDPLQKKMEYHKPSYNNQKKFNRNFS